MVILNFFICVISLFILSQFIRFKVASSVFDFYLSIVSILTFIISTFAIYTTNGKTLYWSFILILIYLFYNKKVSINNFSIIKFKKDAIYLIYTIPVLIVQLFYNFDFVKFKPKIVSDDLIIYAGYSNHLVEFGQENKYAMFSQFYPKLFSGLNPYHFYEIWLNGFVSSTINTGYLDNLIFVTYPLLIWILIIGFNSMIDGFNLKYSFGKVACFLFLFMGPFYLPLYETVFKDGNFVDFTVFTIPGFVKQTLPFSYFGQKHLPVLIFSVIIIKFLTLRDWKSAIISLHSLMIASFGLFPGAYAMIVSFLFSEIKNKRKYILFLLIISFTLFFGVISFNKIQISDEISKSTFYINYFLKELNWKGEILRIVYKLFIPAIWLFILYFPVIFLVVLNLKLLKSNLTFLAMIKVISFSYIGATLFTLLIEGLNTEQFITNLLPFYNVTVIVIIMMILTTEKSHNKLINLLNYFTVILILTQNIYFTSNFQNNFKSVLDEKYQKTNQDLLINELKKDHTKFIAYLLSDKTVSYFHPMHQCIKLPAKFLYTHDYFNQLNINYPYYEYPENSTYYSFAPYNQMKYFLNNKKIEIKDFPKEQIRFLKHFKINWILCEKNAILPNELKIYVVSTIKDNLSGEVYYKLFID